MKNLGRTLLQLSPELALIGLSYPVSGPSELGFAAMFKVTLLLIFQNASFTIVSRARQSSNLTLHAIAAVFSNGFFIFIITTYAAHYDNLTLKLWYILCTVIGSVHAHHLSLHKIEKSKAFKKDSLITTGQHQAAVDRQEQAMSRLEQRIAKLEQDTARTSIPLSAPALRFPAQPVRSWCRSRNDRNKKWVLRQLGQMELSFN